MREWLFNSYRPVDPHARHPISRRSPIHRASGVFTGSAQDALAFARKACEHLSAKGVLRVEAWAAGEPEAIHGSAIFRLTAHANGKQWIAENSGLHHGGIFPDLDSAIDYCVFRGHGMLCRVELLDKIGAVQTVVLVDQTDYNPYKNMGPTWK